MAGARADPYTEKLIEVVKNHRALYDMSDPEYKNVRLKNKIWNEIAREMGRYTGGELKKRWKNIRDCYSKHLRSEETQTGRTATSIRRYKKWPWARQMLFFKPFLHHATTETNVTAIKEENFEIIAQEIEESSPQREVGQKRKRSAVQPENASNSASNTEKFNSLSDKKHKEYESIDLTFQGYAASVKKLSDRRQTMLKFKIAKLIMEEELAEQMESEKEVVSGFSDDSVASFNFNT